MMQLLDGVAKMFVMLDIEIDLNHVTRMIAEHDAGAQLAEQVKRVTVLEEKMRLPESGLLKLGSKERDI